MVEILIGIVVFGVVLPVWVTLGMVIKIEERSKAVERDAEELREPTKCLHCIGWCIAEYHKHDKPHPCVGCGQWTAKATGS